MAIFRFELKLKNPDFERSMFINMEHYTIEDVEKTQFEQVEELLSRTINKRLIQIIISNSRDKEKIEKIKLRPVLIKDKLLFQETAYIGVQVFHENYDRDTVIRKIVNHLTIDFRQCELEHEEVKAAILISKKGKVSIKEKSNIDRKKNGQDIPDLSHNRKKKYILQEGKAVPFLIDLGIQTPEGHIVRARYDKFKQINRFLEFIEDILPTLPKERKINIIDFGCGKSYLTFAMYYYLKQLQRLDVKIIGLDLKTEVIRSCNELALKYGYEDLEFLQGDISTYEGKPEKAENQADMVVTLHACDTATDYALAKAVLWNAGVILSVPCCQHEVNKQIKCNTLQPVLKYGLLRERMSALFTDAIRANLLEKSGYEVQILEFIDMEHTPKNILIRAVKKKETMKKKDLSIEEFTDFLHVETTLQNLLNSQAVNG